MDGQTLSLRREDASNNRSLGLLRLRLNFHINIVLLLVSVSGVSVCVTKIIFCLSSTLLYVHVHIVHGCKDLKAVSLTQIIDDSLSRCKRNVSTYVRVCPRVKSLKVGACDCDGLFAISIAHLLL